METDYDAWSKAAIERNNIKESHMASEGGLFEYFDALKANVMDPGNDIISSLFERYDETTADGLVNIIQALTCEIALTGIRGPKAPLDKEDYEFLYDRLIDTQNNCLGRLAALAKRQTISKTEIIDRVKTDD